MADSAEDIPKMKVVELKKELKTRGLATTGDKSELVARLQAALSKDANNENTLDSDELDSDGVLEDDDDDKNTTDLINEDLINDIPLTESTTSKESSSENNKSNTQTITRILKRKPPPVNITASNDNINEDKLLSPDEPTPPKVKITSPDDGSAGTKKIVLNRIPITAPTTVAETKSDNVTEPKITKVVMDPKDKLAMRAQRFGTPLSSDAAKEARKTRFGNISTNSTTTTTKIQVEKEASLDVLKKRAERFGTSVSKTMMDLEYKERLERRKAKFGVSNA